MPDYRISIVQDNSFAGKVYVELLNENTGEILAFGYCFPDKRAIADFVSKMIVEFLEYQD
jgi:hypothetical protein